VIARSTEAHNDQPVRFLNNPVTRIPETRKPITRQPCYPAKEISHSVTNNTPLCLAASDTFNSIRRQPSSLERSDERADEREVDKQPVGARCWTGHRPAEVTSDPATEPTGDTSGQLRGELATSASTGAPTSMPTSNPADKTPSDPTSNLSGKPLTSGRNERNGE
jgi:hypothetical protein